MSFRDDENFRNEEDRLRNKNWQPGQNPDENQSGQRYDSPDNDSGIDKLSNAIFNDDDTDDQTTTGYGRAQYREGMSASEYDDTDGIFRDPDATDRSEHRATTTGDYDAGDNRRNNDLSWGDRAEQGFDNAVDKVRDTVNDWTGSDSDRTWNNTDRDSRIDSEIDREPGMGSGGYGSPATGAAGDLEDMDYLTQSPNNTMGSDVAGMNQRGTTGLSDDIQSGSSFQGEVRSANPNDELRRERDFSSTSDYGSGFAGSGSSLGNDRSNDIDSDVDRSSDMGYVAGGVAGASTMGAMGSDRVDDDDIDDVVSELNDLIEICNDGNFGYKTAAENVQDASLKSLFMRYAQQRQQFVSELKSCVHQLGGETAEGGDWQGALHRTWINLKNAVTTREDKAMLEECITGDEAAVRSYRDSLEEEYLVGHIREVVQRQCAAIEEALQTVRAHRDRRDMNSGSSSGNRTTY